MINYDKSSHRLKLSQTAIFTREFHSMIGAAIIFLIFYMSCKAIFPNTITNQQLVFLHKYVGIAWPFFIIVTIFLFYVAGAWMVESFGFVCSRSWGAILQILNWATEACPLVGLLTTFLSFLTALTVYADAGPSNPETQSTFIAQFAIAFGSSIAGGLLALIAFTFHRVLPSSN